MSARNLHRLAAFVADLDVLVSTPSAESGLLVKGAALLSDLVRRDDWLPDACAEADPDRYRQYLLYRDPAARFSVVSFVWGPGQATPIHNHTVWGLIGMLRGAELTQDYQIGGLGQIGSPGLRPAGPERRLTPGQVDAVSPTIGDIHRVANAFDDQVSISIHVYGADIGQIERATFDGEGRPKLFVSGYAPLAPPNLMLAVS